MKRFLFNEHYGLRSAVIDGRKTMTRRIAKALNHHNVCNISEWGIDNKGKAMLTITCNTGLQEDVYPHFQIGETVAIAQPYETFMSHQELCDKGLLTSVSVHNSMFVKSSLMPHQVRITGIKLERLQDITDEDCLREGVEKWINCYIVAGIMEHGGKNNTTFDTPRQAFASLIDKTCGKGTWEANPWTWNYEFELIK